MRSHAALLGLLLALAGHAGASTVEALVLNPRGQPVMDAAVVLEPLAPLAQPHAKNHPTASIAQRGSEFIPFVTVAQTGTAIEFPNNDTTRHHVYSFSPAKRFEIKLYAGKPGQPIIFDKPGQVAIGCNIHDWMEAYVLVVDSPYFGTTAGNGKAVLANIPAGHYKVHLWHPQQKVALAPVDIEVGNSPASLKLVLDVKPRERKPRSDTDQDRY
jgi:plastocyanin